MPLYFYLSGSACLGSFTAPNKQLPSERFLFKSFDHVSDLYEIYELTTILWKKDTVSYFKQISLNCTLLNLCLQINSGAKVVS